MAKITYADKSYLNENANVPATNKVTDTDMNEIKSVVNSNYDSEQADIASFFYESGDILELGSTTPANVLVMPGYITSSTASLFITLYTPKRLDNITSIAVNNLEIEARGISGYLNSQSGFIEYVGDNNYTITTGISGDNAITIIITKSSAFTNTTNNTPVVLSGYVKLTFS